MHILVKYVYSVCGGGLNAKSFTFFVDTWIWIVL